MGDEIIKPGLETLVGYNLKRAYVIMLADFRKTLEEDTLTTRSFSALSLVIDFPGISQTHLSRRLGMERSGLVALIDDLEERDYVTRSPVPGDRRVQALKATDHGTQAHQTALAKINAHEARLMSDFTDTEKSMLLTFLQKIRAQEP